MTENVTVHRITMAQFVQALMLEGKRRRKLLHGDRRGLGNCELIASSIGYHEASIYKWERGTRRPTLKQALDCLQGVAA